MILYFSIVHYGLCPLCKVQVHRPVHSSCILKLNQMMQLGHAEMRNWDAPLPGTFLGLRWGIGKQLERQTIFVLSTGAATMSNYFEERL